jgi:hypothetical protein
MTSKILLLLLFIFGMVSVETHAQNASATLRISKISKPEKVRQIADNTRLKIQTLEGEKIKTRLTRFGKDYLLTEKGDTILFEDIHSFRAQRRLNKTEFFIGIPLLIAGTTAAIAGVPIGVMIIFTESSGTALFVLPPAGLAATLAGKKMVGRKTYHTGKWKITRQ